MVHSLCSAYHWDFETATRRTFPQIIMLNYEAWAEGDRWERKRESDKANRNKEDLTNPVVDYNGNRMEDVVADPLRMDAYMMGLGNFTE